MLVEQSQYNPDQMQVVHSFSYKNIIQTDLVRETGKYSIGTTNLLELKYVRNSEQYEKYILAKWAKYKASVGQDLAEDELLLEPNNFVQILQLRFGGGEQSAIDF